MDVVIFGFGHVGRVLTFGLLQTGKPLRIHVIDPSAKIAGGLLDLQHAAEGTDHSISRADQDVLSKADFIFHCAGGSVLEGMTRLDLAKSNSQLTRDVFSKYSLKPDCKVIVISNPVDVLTYWSWKASGLPKEQVVGTGTMLEVLRLSQMLHGERHLVLGEHGPSCSVVGKDRGHDWEGIHKELVGMAGRIKQTAEVTKYGVCQVAIMIFIAFQSEKEIEMVVGRVIESNDISGLKCSPVALGVPVSISSKGCHLNSGLIGNDELEAIEHGIKILSQYTVE